MPEIKHLPIVTVAISSMGKSYRDIQLPPPAKGIQYLILVQKPPGEFDSPFGNREDVEIHALQGIGLSRSRNAALDNCQTRYLLVSDDDVLVYPSGISALRDILIQRENVHFATGWRLERLPTSGKHAQEYKLTPFNSGRICAPEFLIDVDAFRDKKIRFDIEFGLGAEYGVGEEYVFLTDAMKAGLEGISCPIATGSHPDDSTGNIWQDTDLLRARAMLLKRVFGGWSTIIRIAYLLRHWRKFPSRRAIIQFAMGHYRA